MESKGIKTLKFRNHLVKEIQEGRKNVTWRLFDDKNLSVGDQLDLLDWESDKKFAEAKITEVREKELGQIEESDFEGHEKYSSREAMLQHYKEYYGDKVTLDTIIKIVNFEILRFLK
jgi:hypothetical protein